MIVRADADGQGARSIRSGPYLLRDPKRSVAKRREAGVREPARDRGQRRPWLVLSEELLGDPVEQRI
jgi:hypothetical protein